MIHPALPENAEQKLFAEGSHMREAVEKVLGAEREAKEKIEQAKSLAAELKAAADKAAEAKLSEARENAAMLLRDRLDAARKEAAALLAEGQKSADAEAERWYAEREPELDSWARQVLDAVLKTDLGKR